jgi:hypothetical protein
MRIELKLENAKRSDRLEGLDVDDRILIRLMLQLFGVGCGSIKLAQKMVKWRAYLTPILNFLAS